MIACAVCGRPTYTNTGFEHPVHTDAELAETKAAVDAAASALTFLFYLEAARLAARSVM